MSLHPSTAFRAPPPAVSFEELAASLNRSISNAIRHRPYSRGVVMAFHWANDDIGVDGLEGQLLDIFRQIYRYEVNTYIIPLVNSELKLINTLNGWFQANQGDGVLRIVVYSGHARAAGTTAETWMLGGRVDNFGNLQGPMCDWWRIRYFLTGFVGETCYIFDCCSGGSLALGDDTGDELIASCGWGGVCSSANTWSFTQALIDTLQDLNGSPATLAEIYATLFRRAQQSQVGGCPVHVPSRERPSVTLASSGIQRRLSRATNTRPNSRVLISVIVRASMPHNPAPWTAWLAQNIPSDVVDADIRFEAAFRGSCILLVSMPVAIWTMLPRDNPAYSFIAHAHANSTILPIWQQPMTLPTRPAVPAARENSPPNRPHRQPSPRKKDI